jgi:hypothetical protein
MWHAWDSRESVQDFGGKSQKKEFTQKTELSMEDGIEMDPRETD